jgi:hypothetical protein
MRRSFQILSFCSFVSKITELWKIPAWRPSWFCLPLYTWSSHIQLSMWGAWIFKFIPHTCSDCSCALLMVIAKASRTGNCKRLNSKGISVGIIGMRGNSTSSPLNFSFKIVASMILFIIFFTESLLPFSSSSGHWDTLLADAANTAQPQQIRTLFAIILTTCFPSNPKDLWEKYKDYMCEDILHRLRVTNQNPDESNWTCTTEHVQCSISFDWAALNRSANNLFDRDLRCETQFDVVELGNKKNWLSKICENYFKLLLCNLVTWPFGHLVINLFGSAHNNYAKKKFLKFTSVIRNLSFNRPLR